MGIPSKSLPPHIREQIKAQVDRRTPPTLFSPTVTTLETDFPPNDNNLYGHRVIGGGRKVFAKRYLTAEGRAFKKHVAQAGLLAGLRPSYGDFIVFIDLYRPARRGDTFGFDKAILDALTGVAWHDDGQIVAGGIFRHDDPGNPRAVIEIRRIG